ncbi:MAG: carbamoyltransferase [Candidatus Omnitrophica bacterium]|nr:MAG: Decarbamoylnovobiocin carbamoyltransferase [Candidatus Hinthialibacteria bacterium OLB16]MCK6496693.1 carbamoyltransferase [bacterium]MCL4735174.1 carbamoyltransferase [Candidatus Omnitrophota bacterium]NUP91609.1 carbamoyltransferase [Candidatus Omnitrophota bacterium]
MSEWILGISAYYHDSAAALLKDGEIFAAAQEERFTRKKHDSDFPRNAIEYCLREAGISVDQLTHVVFYEKPFVKFERILETYLCLSPRGLTQYLQALPLWLTKRLWMGDDIGEELGYQGDVLFAEHHESHAASAFFPSPFEEAAVLTVDGVGEWSTTTYGVGKGNDLNILAELRFPHSLGLLYSAFTYYTGFKVNSAEYKVMGLAPYGEPKYVDRILNDLIDLKEDGSVSMNMDYFGYLTGLRMTNSKFDSLFGGPPRKPESRLSQREMDLARSVQVVTEMAMLKLAKHVQEVTGQENLCLAGGVALNCVANGRILREGPFKRVWIQPAAGDAGGALGAALAVHYRYKGHPRTVRKEDAMKGSLLGPSYTDEEIEAELKRLGAVYHKLDRQQFLEGVSDRLVQEKVVGWFSGRMEFGPRALGGRSIIGDPRSRNMQSVMNLKIKYRESFRPFAPSVLEEECSKVFEIASDSPYMLLVAPVQKNRRIAMTEEQEKLFGIDKLNVPRSDIPAITHIDYSARIQTVNQQRNGLYHDMIRAFYEKTGCPLVVNTSFNVRGEPIVESPTDAYRCFMRTEMDCLAIGSFILDKNDQPEWKEEGDWRKEFELD